MRRDGRGEVKGDLSEAILSTSAISSKYFFKLSS